MVDFFSIKHTLVFIPLGSGYNMSYIEAVGTIFGLLCVWYASMEKTINYVFGLANVTLFAIIFYQIQLYGNVLLQVFFFIANLYGIYSWSLRSNKTHEHVLKIRWMSKTKLISVSIVSIVAIILLSYYIDSFFIVLTKLTIDILNLFGSNTVIPVATPDAYPLLDSLITVLSVVAMILMTRKYIENWLLWVLINIVSIYLYAKQGVYAMSLEYILLLLIAMNGARCWIKDWLKMSS